MSSSRADRLAEADACSLQLAAVQQPAKRDLDSEGATGRKSGRALVRASAVPLGDDADPGGPANHPAAVRWRERYLRKSSIWAKRGSSRDVRKERIAGKILAPLVTLADRSVQPAAALQEHPRQLSRRRRFPM